MSCHKGGKNERIYEGITEVLNKKINYNKQIKYMVCMAVYRNFLRKSYYADQKRSKVFASYNTSTCNACLSVQYRLSIIYMLSASEHRTFVNSFEVTIN
jgi:hypothetical protein